ncbi:MAG: SDR family NAD(P)-dependent oxidoreductase, partial [Clostridiales bacterium]|nr:SDR family NAD(P)-dependent oxidoreductase [Clostridiales bacterium]
MKKVALITGASRGIGAAIARKFAEDGYQLALCCSRSADALDALADELRAEYSAEVMTRIGDVGSYEFVLGLCEDVLECFGHVDVLINNAGVAHIGLLQDMSIGEWNRMLSVDLSAAFAACKALIPSMVARQSGRIINISSVWG